MKTRTITHFPSFPTTHAWYELTQVALVTAEKEVMMYLSLVSIQGLLIFHMTSHATGFLESHSYQLVGLACNIRECLAETDYLSKCPAPH